MSESHFTPNFSSPEVQPEVQPNPAQDNSSGNGSLLRAGSGRGYAQPPAPTEGEGVVTGHAPDHYVHLADGSVVAGCSGGTVFHDADNGLIPIVSVFPAGRELPR